MHFARSWVVFAIVGLVAAQQPTSPSAPKPLAGSRPNIVLVLSDDHACQAIGAYGAPFGATPVLDRFAQSGVTFTRAYCGNAICGPSRASILTGLHSHANGFTRNGNVFDAAQPTFPALLQASGYQTALFGKWHLEATPVGFDTWQVLPDQGQYHNPDFLTANGRVRHAGHATDVVTALSLQWLEQRDPERPFLLLCQHKAPHRNWLPAPSELGLFRDRDLPLPATLFDDHRGRIAARAHTEMEIARHLTRHYDLMVPPTASERDALGDLDRSYLALRARMSDEQRAQWDAAYGDEDAAFVRANLQGEARVKWYAQRYLKNYLRTAAGVDRSVGELLAWLDAHPDVKANTLFVYASDQGFFLGEHGLYDKRWMDEETARLPLLMAWPGRLAGGQRSDALVQNIDLAPTVLELAGVPPPRPLHGTSLVPLLAGKATSVRDAIYYHYYESLATHAVPAMYGVRTERHKLVRYYEPHVDAWELFDLQLDPDELQNVADDPQYAEVRAELTTRLRLLRQQYGDDTGELGDGAFPLVAGVARIVRDGDGHRLWCNALSGYALQPCEPKASATIATSLRSVAAKPLRQGFVVLGGAEPRRDQIRVGFEFGARRLVVLGPLPKQRAEVAIELASGDAVDLQIAVDCAAHRLVAKAAGKELVVELPAAWAALHAVGYGGSNSETWFAPLVVR